MWNVQAVSEGTETMAHLCLHVGAAQAWIFLSSREWSSSYCFWQEHPPELGPVINHGSMDIDSTLQRPTGCSVSSNDTDTEGALLRAMAYPDAIMGDTEIPNRSWDLRDPRVLTTK